MRVANLLFQLQQINVFHELLVLLFGFRRTIEQQLSLRLGRLERALDSYSGAARRLVQVVRRYLGVSIDRAALEVKRAQLVLILA